MYANTVTSPRLHTLALALAACGLLRCQTSAWASDEMVLAQLMNGPAYEQNLAQADLTRPATGARSGIPSVRVLPLEVTVNGEKVGNWVFVESNGILYAPEETFTDWRLNRRNGAEAIDYRGEKWFSLASVPGYQSSINPASNTLVLEFSGQAFAATRITNDAVKRIAMTRAETAAFLNYDVNASHTASKGLAAATDVGALLELGVTGPWGVLTSSHLANNLTSDPAARQRKFTRLETTFNKDFPERNMTMRVGDTSTRSGISGRSVYFGGVQIGRNFSLNPNFTTQPLPVVSGTSSAPSTVELYVNDVLRQTSNVPTGPFVIDNFPVISTAGDARVVVRDVLGRETVLTVPFFAHADLLEQSLSDWSLDLGAVRKNFGASNYDYGERFMAGLYRYGVNKSLTLEGNAQLGQEHTVLGAGASVALPWQLLGRVGATVSNTDGLGRGHQWLVGLEQVNLKDGFTLRAQGASRDYRTLGDLTASYTSKLQLSASYRKELNKDHSIGLGLAQVKTYGNGTVNTASANYTWRLENRSAVTLNVSRAVADNFVSSLSGNRDTTRVGVSWSMPLDNQINLTTNVTHQNGRTEGYVAASKNLSADTGVGWRTLAGSREGEAFAEGGLYYQGTKGLLTADISAARSQQAVRVGAQGGAVLIDGKAFASRTVSESFALVHVPGYANVGVGFHGDRLNNTDADGYALVTRLVPFMENKIRLNAEELPIGAEIESIEQSVVPPQRSGVKVTFPVRSGQAVLLKIVLDDGEVAPAGALIKIEGDKQDFYVARRGEAFVTGLQATNQLQLNWNNTQCTIALTVPQSAKKDEIVRLGPVVCKGVKR
jgi:outer membrane usher protein